MTTQIREICHVRDAPNLPTVYLRNDPNCGRRFPLRRHVSEFT
jgi:hypothetical protein